MHKVSQNFKMNINIQTVNINPIKKVVKYTSQSV